MTYKQITMTALMLVLLPLGAQDFSQNLPQTQAKPVPNAALLQQANEALAKPDLPLALKLLTELDTQTPNDSQILFNLGYTQEALNHPTEAAAAYRKAILADPKLADAHVALGLLLARTGDGVEAAIELRTAVADPAADNALRARASRALARLEQETDAALASSDLLHALTLSPEQPDDILLSAELATASGDLPGAEKAYTRYLALSPSDPAATAALATILLRDHRQGDAETLLTAALTQHPGDPALTAQLAAAYVASPDPAKIALAVPIVTSLHTAHSEDASITRLLARLDVETGHPDQADPLYAGLIAAAGANPDPTLLADRADTLLRLHRPGEAEALLKLAVANPRGFPTPTALGDAAMRLAFAASEIDDPRVTLQAVAVRDTVLPPSPSSLFLEATANDSLHQTSQAVDMYKKFLAAAAGSYPDQEMQAHQRLALLEHRK